MSNSRSKRRFIRLLRLYPVFLLALVGVIFLLGGFSDNPNAFLPKSFSYTIFLILLVVAPIGAMLGFIIIGRTADREFLQNSVEQDKFEIKDPFELPNEVMHGYKLAGISGRVPTLIGITGDLYGADDSAKCGVNPDHVPPVKDCQCGFHAYKELSEAAFELSTHRNTFLFDVDLYGLGFVYKRGYRAETQVVNRLIAPKRCMLCKTLKATRFITKYEFSGQDVGLWRWQMRCATCSLFTKTADQMSIDEMAQRLKITIV